MKKKNLSPSSFKFSRRSLRKENLRAKVKAGKAILGAEVLESHLATQETITKEPTTADS
jgi:hypothetical protein